MNEARAKSIEFDKEHMWVALTDGRKLGVPLAFFPRLLNASKKERENFEVSGGGVGLHWESIDEDISVPGLLLGLGDQTQSTDKAA